MSEPDEYDAYFVPLSLNNEDLDAIDAAASKARLHNHNTAEGHLARTPPSPDEFDAYDLSEFSAADFAAIDKLVDRLCGPSPLPPIHEVHNDHERDSTRSGSRVEGGSPGRGGGGVPNGGPAIEITVENDRKADPCRRLKDSRTKHAKRSPYDQFRKWRRVLTVTDIAGPSWQVLASSATRIGMTSAVTDVLFRLGVRCSSTMVFGNDEIGSSRIGHHLSLLRKGIPSPSLVKLLQ